MEEKIRDKLLVEAGHVCVICGDSHVQIHHIDGNSNNNDESNLIVLCLKHHDEAEKSKQGRGISANLTPEQLRLYKERMPKHGKTLYLPHSLHNQTPPEPNFVGRRNELKTITQWYRDPNTHIGVLVGWGGFGKSALARRWFDLLKDNNIHPDAIFWWGFYRNAYLDRFLDELLGYVAGRTDLTTSWQKVEEIKRHITKKEYLIFLDGLEEMQEQAEGER